MIFSTDRCPLCNDKLELEIRELSLSKASQVVFIYRCKRTELVRNDSNTTTIAKIHYQNECYQGGQLCEMVIPPFTLFHSESNNMTGVYKSGTDYKQAKKLIFRTTLLDLDYSEPHVVLTKLKLLVTFS